LFELFRARVGGGLAPKCLTVNEEASTSGSSSGSSIVVILEEAQPESPSQSLTEEAELNLPEPENRSVSDAGECQILHCDQYY